MANQPMILGCCALGIIAGFVSCTSGGNSPSQANIEPQQQSSTEVAEQSDPTEANNSDRRRRGDVEAIYLEDVRAQCQPQIDGSLAARTFELWNKARGKMAEDGKPAEFHLFLMLDALYADARSKTRGKTFDGSAESQYIIRPIATDIQAILSALEYADKSETPPAPQVNLSDCLTQIDVLLNEALAVGGEDAD